MTPDQGLVSIIIVNWNGWRDTVECIASTRQLDYPNFEVIVVDNASTDDSVGRIREHCPEVRIIEAGENLGFAGGNNVGIRAALKAGAHYVWPLNNDTVVEARALSQLVEAHAAHPNAGALGSKILFFDRPKTVWFAGGFISKTWGWTQHRGESETDSEENLSPSPVDYVSGASMLVPSLVLEKVGLMREEYFLYWEEVDWCTRIRKAGFDVLYVPASRIWHKVGASTPKDQEPRKWRYEGRNRVLFYRLNEPGKVGWIARRTALNVAFLLMRGRVSSACGMASGLIDGLRNRSGRIA